MKKVIITLAIISMLFTGTAYATIFPTAGQDVVDHAKILVGTTPYVWGGQTPYVGMDCSGFTKWAYAWAGVYLPHNAQMQWENYGKFVPKSKLKAGDLVFFTGTANDGNYITHNGIYVGNGMFIEESSAYNGVVIKPLFSGYYGKHYYGAKRIFN